jgi:hypothetical protein
MPELLAALRVRHVQLNEDRLVLSVLTTRANGARLKSTLTWIGGV